MSNTVIAIGLTGGVDTVSKNREVLFGAGVTRIEEVAVPEGATSAEKHAALCAQAKAVRKENPDAHLLILKDRIVPLRGEAFPDGTMAIGALDPLSKTRALQTVKDVQALSLENAAPKPPALITSARVEGTLPEARIVEKPKSKVEQRTERKEAKRAGRAAVEKPTIVMLHTKPVDIRSLNLSSSKAKLVHVLLAPQEVDAQCLGKDGLFDKKALGHLQGQKGEKLPFMHWANTSLGLSFWNKFDAAVGSEAQLTALLQAIQPNGVMVCGDIPRDYAIAMHTITDSIASSVDARPKIIAYNGEIGTYQMRLAVNDAAREIGTTTRAA